MIVDASALIARPRSASSSGALGYDLALMCPHLSKELRPKLFHSTHRRRMSAAALLLRLLLLRYLPLLLHLLLLRLLRRLWLLVAHGGPLHELYLRTVMPLVLRPATLLLLLLPLPDVLCLLRPVLSLLLRGCQEVSMLAQLASGHVSHAQRCIGLQQQITPCTPVRHLTIIVQRL